MYSGDGIAQYEWYYGAKFKHDETHVMLMCRMGHYYEYQPQEPGDMPGMNPEEGSTATPDEPVDSLAGTEKPDEPLLGPDGFPLETELPDGTYEYGYRRAPGRAHRHDYGYMNHMYGGMYNESDFVMVDAHILTSPVLADINGDGNMEVFSCFKVPLLCLSISYLIYRLLLTLSTTDIIFGIILFRQSGVHW